MRQGSNWILLHVEIQLLQHHLLTISFPLNILSISLENQLAIDPQVYLWILNSVTLIYVSILIPVTCCFGCCSCVVRSLKSESESCSFFLLFPRLFWLFRPPWNSIQISGLTFPFLQKGYWNFDGDNIECVDCFEEHCHVNTVFQFMNSKFFKSLFWSSLISFNSVLWLSVYEFLTLWLNLFLYINILSF